MFVTEGFVGVLKRHVGAVVEEERAFCGGNAA